MKPVSELKPKRRYPKPAKRKPAPTPQKYILCIGKWVSMALTAEIYGFELIDEDEQEKVSK